MPKIKLVKKKSVKKKSDKKKFDEQIKKKFDKNQYNLIFNEDYLKQDNLKYNSKNDDNIDIIKDKIYKDLNITNDIYSIFFTSGEIESNTIVICAIINAYKNLRKVIPHVALSSVESHSINKYLLSLKDSGQITLTIIKPNVYGCILSEHIVKAINENTCCVIVSYINREMGSVNNINIIGDILHKQTPPIPLHCDCSYMYGRHKLDLTKDNIDSAVISFDKIHGNYGIGAIVIKNDLLNGYKLKDQSITLDDKRKVNIPLLTMGYKMIENNLKDRKTKNEKMLNIKKYFVNQLASKFDMISYLDYINSDSAPLTETKQSKCKVIILGPPIDNSQYYTYCILSVIFICNADYNKEVDDIEENSNTFATSIKDKLVKKKILVDMPDLKSNAEILYKELNMESKLKEGILRFFISDDITQAYIDTLIAALTTSV